jgi:hypothetical protein
VRARSGIRIFSKKKDTYFLEGNSFRQNGQVGLFSHGRISVPIKREYGWNVRPLPDVRSRLVLDWFACTHITLVGLPKLHNGLSFRVEGLVGD